MLAVAILACSTSNVQADITDGLISYWPMDEGSGTVAADVAGSNDGTLTTGDGSGGAGTGVIPAWDAGKFGGGLYFDGVSSVVDCGNDASLKPANVSIAAWIKTDYYVYYGQIAGYASDTGSSESGYSIITEDIGYIGAWLTGSGGSYPGDGWYLWTTDVPAYPNVDWVHVALTYDGVAEESILYVNGVSKASSYQGGDVDYDHVLNFLIGSYDDPIGSYWFPYEGLIDDVAVWDRALSQAEIDYLYNGGTGNTPAGLIKKIRPVASVHVPVDEILEWTSPTEFTATGYDVYFGTEPNVIENTKVVVNVLTNTHDPFGAGDMATDTTYYWQVDIYEGATKYDGVRWNFTTEGVPAITSDPENVVVAAGGTADFSVEQVSGVDYEWHKVGVGLIDSGTVTGPTVSLQLTNVLLANEGHYYCKIINSSGNVDSATAKLMTSRLIGHWPMNGTGTDRSVPDSSAGGIDGTVVTRRVDDLGATVTGDSGWSWVTGGIDGNALDLAQNSTDPNVHDYVILATSGDPTDLDFGATTDFSVSVWFKGTDFAAGSGYDPAIISNKDWYSGGNDGYIMDINTNSTPQQIEWNIGDGGSRADYDPSGGAAINDGAWHHMVATHDRDGDATMYLDGVLQAQISIAHIGDIDPGLPTCIGTDGTEGVVWPAWFRGTIDDVRMWNYVINPYAVAKLYIDFVPAAASWCVEGETIPYDYDGDCIVNLGDLAAAGLQWLDCNIVPDCLSEHPYSVD